VREFSRDHRLIRYDERANGLSDWDVDDVSFDALVKDFEAVIAAAGLERFSVLAVSQGCAVAAAYAARNPGRVSRLVLYGGYARGWAKRGNSALPEALNTLIEHGWGQDNPIFRQVFTSMFIPGASSEQMQWFNELQRRTASPANALRLRQAFGQIDVRPLLPELRVPTLVLHCRDDQVINFEEGRLLASLIPTSRFVPLEGRNHVILESDPAWPRFLDEVRAFLAEAD
jgi:pimeloyl-ACP methyl ester carboxylesterase